MKTVTVQIEQEKLDALKFYLEKNGKDLQSELDERLKNLYEQTVPEEAREYIAYQAKQRLEARAQAARDRREVRTGKKEQPVRKEQAAE